MVLFQLPSTSSFRFDGDGDVDGDGAFCSTLKMNQIEGFGGCCRSSLDLGPAKGGEVLLCVIIHASSSARFIK